MKAYIVHSYTYSHIVSRGICVYVVCVYNVKVDNYVAVEPPAKRQQLLTEHQREKFRERSDSIPALYNALDPSQDPSQFTTTQSSVPDR